MLACARDRSSSRTSGDRRRSLCKNGQRPSTQTPHDGLFLGVGIRPRICYKLLQRHARDAASLHNLTSIADQFLSLTNTKRQQPPKQTTHIPPMRRSSSAIDQRSAPLYSTANITPFGRRQKKSG